MNKVKRVVVYINEEDHRRAKSKLALLGMSLSEWIRKAIRELID